MSIEVKKDEFDFDKTMVTMKFVLRNRDKIIIHTNLRQSCDFVDFINNNSAVIDEGYREAFKDRYYVFDDFKKKETITISLQDVMLFSVPFLWNTGDHYISKILDFKR